MSIDFHTTCKYSFLDSALGDILRAIDGKSLMGSMILSYCVIDYMAQAISPNWSGTRSDFKRYVTDYLGNINIVYKELGDEMYAVRNSLIHSYGESDSSRKLSLQFLFSTNSFKENHLQINTIENGKLIYFDLPKLISEIIISILSFFESNIENESLFETWYLNKIKVLKSKIFTKDQLNKDSIFPFGQIHNSLSFFNDNNYNDKDSVNNFANIIRNQCCS